MVNSNERHNHGDTNIHDHEGNNEENYSFSNNMIVEADVDNSNIINKEISKQNNGIANNKDGHNHQH